MADTKPRSTASINADAATKATRTIGRVPRLRAAIERAEAKGNAARVASLTAELDRRLSERDDLMSTLSEV